MLIILSLPPSLSLSNLSFLSNSINLNTSNDHNLQYIELQELERVSF